MELQTARPVIIRYMTDVAPSDDHPAGVPAGYSGEVATPEQAWAIHPEATIIRYTDGADYDQRKARREVNARNKAAGVSDAQDGTEDDDGSEAPKTVIASPGVTTQTVRVQDEHGDVSEIDVVPVELTLPDTEPKAAAKKK